MTGAEAQPRLRQDLVVAPDGEDGGGRVVKDPNSRKFYRFDALEGFILERLDGKSSPVDIQVAVATELGEALSLEDVQEFIDELGDKGFLDSTGNALPAHRPDLGAKFFSVLEQGGFGYRRAGDSLPPNVDPAQRNLAEARKFDEAVAALRAGRFKAALRSFDEILAANPGNRRAAAVRGLLVKAGSQLALAEAEQGPAEPDKKNNLLYYRIPFFNPDRIFSALEPFVRFTWSWAFLALYATVLTLAGWIVWGHGTEIFAALPELSFASLAAGFVAAAIVQTALHECAHGLTCKHFGGRVPELGFLLILFFLPALYVDVSDAWLFRKRRQRVLVSLAGPMFDLGVAALAALAWRVIPPGPAHNAAVILMAASFASVVLNLNPLLRLDGYYILADLSGIPNLRATARRYIAQGIARLRGRSQEAEVVPTPGARTFLLLYGVLSLLYMGFIFIVLGSIVVGGASRVAGLWGPAFVLVGVVWMLRKPLKLIGSLLIGKLKALSFGRTVRLALAASVLVAVSFIPWSLKVSGEVVLDSREKSAVRPEIPGNLAEIFVEEGDRVSAGQLVARLDTSELDAQYAMARAEMRRARAQLDLVLRGPEQEEIRQAREKVSAGEVEVAQLRSRYERLSRLRREGLVAADMHEQVASELKVREGALRASRDQARLLEKGARPEEVEAARAELARLQTEASDLERRLGACELHASASGIVVTPQLRERLGERVSAGGLILEIAGSDALVAAMRVLESEIGDVQVGQEVRLVLSAFPDRTFRGRVEEIAPAAELDELGRALFRVKASVDEGEGLLRPGMTGAAKVRAGSMPLGKLVLRRVLRMIDPSLL